MATGSAFESITLNGRNFTCDSESEPEVDLAKYTNEVAPNTDGTYRTIKKRKVQSIEGITLSINPALGDREFVNGLNDGLTPFPFMATRIDGSVYSGEVTLTSDGKFKETDSTMEVTLQGRIEAL